MIVQSSRFISTYVCTGNLSLCSAHSPYSYNAIKAYTREGRQTELSATEHLVSAAEAG